MNKDEKTITVKELSKVLNVSDKHVRETIKKIMPDKLENGKTTYLNEKEATAIKLEMSRNPYLNQLVEVKTDLEKELIIMQALRFQQEKITSLKEENESLIFQIEEQKPAVEFSELVRDSKNGIIVREFCKLLTPPVGQNKFYAWLRNQKIIMPNSTEPYQEYIDRGYFARRETTYKNSDDESIVSFTTLITGKGQQYLTKKWKAKAVA